MIESKVHGVPEFIEALTSIPKKLRRRALLNALKAGARVVQAEARSKTPVLRLGTRAPFRKPGTVRGAISVRTSKVAQRAGDVGVFVNVKPLPGNKFKTIRSTGVFGGKTTRRVLVKKSRRSAQNPNDPFYWAFINFGTKKLGGSHFLEAGARRLGEALAVFERTLGPQIQRLDQNPKDPL